MRIAMIGQKGIPCKGGGVERHVEALSVELARTGHDVIVYTRPYYTPRKLSFYQGVRLVSLPSFARKHFDAISHSLLSTIHAMWRRVDVIHYHGVGPSLVSFIPRVFAPRIKIVGTFHSADWEHQKWGIVARTILKIGAYAISLIPHVTLAVSRDIVRMVRSLTGRRALYIPSGVRVPDETPSRQLLRAFRLTVSPYILLVSRFVRHKCLHEAIAAFITLKQDPRLPKRLQSLKLVLAGGGAFTDNYVKELHTLAKGRSDIVFTGFVHGETLHALYAHASACVQPSVAEGRSIAIMEACAWGLPVIAADIKESRELLLADHEGKKAIGTLYPSHDVAALRTAMRLVMTRRPAALRMGMRAQETMRKAYQWEHIANWIDAVYLRLGVCEQDFSDIEYALKKAEAR